MTIGLIGLGLVLLLAFMRVPLGIALLTVAGLRAAHDCLPPFDLEDWTTATTIDR